MHQKRLQISEATRNAVGELNSAQAELESSRKRVLIVRDLSSRQHASDEELFRAENELLVAEANLKTVQEKLRLRQAEYEKLQAESQHYQVTAPFDGVIVSYTKQRGEFVGSVAPEVCVIAELDRLSVDFLLPRQNRPRVPWEMP